MGKEAILIGVRLNKVAIDLFNTDQVLVKILLPLLQFHTYGWQGGEIKGIGEQHFIAFFPEGEKILG